MRPDPRVNPAEKIDAKLRHEQWKIDSVTFYVENMDESKHDPNFNIDEEPHHRFESKIVDNIFIQKKVPCIIVEFSEK